MHECIPSRSGCSPMLGISLICCAVLAEHVSSNASDSESSYRKLLLWFVVLFFAIAPLPVVVISDFCCCVPVAALYHPHPKQMAWNEIVVWCGKIQKTLGPSVDSFVICAGSSSLSNKQFQPWLAVACWCTSGGEEGRGEFNLVDFDLLPPKIIKTRCRRDEKSSRFDSPSHFAFFFLSGSPVQEKAWEITVFLFNWVWTFISLLSLTTILR